MNFAFELQTDKPLREGNALQPFRIVSLLDISRFYARGFVKICSNLGHCSGIINALAHPDYSVDLSEIEEEIQQLAFYSRLSGLTISAGNAEVLLEDIKYFRNQNTEKRHYDEIRGKLDSLIQTVLNELNSKTMLMLSPTTSQFYDEKGTFLGQDTIDKFKELERDAIEAGNCFAVGRYTACAFHVMRILEITLRKFARKLKISPTIFEKKSWGVILTQINNKLEYKHTDPDKAKRKKDRYKITHGFLNGVRMAWRDDTIHVRANYDEKEAAKVINAVKLFVEDFAKLR